MTKLGIATLLAATLAIGPGGAMPSAGTRAPAANMVSVTIRVNAEQDPPSRVSFDGSGDFEPLGNSFVGKREFRGSFALSDLAVAYGSYVFPLRVLNRADTPEQPLRVYKAAYGNCEPADVDAVFNAAETGAVDSKVQIIMRAHRLLDLGSCPVSQQRRLTRKYYRVSCALAQDPRSSIRISDDAANRMRVLPNPTPADQALLARCRGAGLAQVLGDFYASVAEARVRGDAAVLASVGDQLSVFASEEEWDEAFEGARITRQQVRELEGGRLLTLQQAAIRSGDIAQAVSINDQMRELKGDEAYREAFDRVGITDTAIENIRPQLPR